MKTQFAHAHRDCGRSPHCASPGHVRGCFPTMPALLSACLRRAQQCSLQTKVSQKVVTTRTAHWRKICQTPSFTISFALTNYTFNSHFLCTFTWNCHLHFHLHFHFIFITTFVTISHFYIHTPFHFYIFPFTLTLLLLHFYILSLSHLYTYTCTLVHLHFLTHLLFYSFDTFALLRFCNFTTSLVL